MAATMAVVRAIRHPTTLPASLPDIPVPSLTCTHACPHAPITPPPMPCVPYPHPPLPLCAPALTCPGLRIPQLCNRAVRVFLRQDIRATLALKDEMGRIGEYFVGLGGCARGGWEEGGGARGTRVSG